MYEQFYGLKEPPFALLPDPSFMYLSKDHGMALTLLRYSILNKQGFTVITGEVGSGKTTLINRIIDELDESITVGLINFTHTAFGELSEWVLMAFGLDYRNKSKVEIYDTFVTFLIDQFSLGKRVVLIIDEAQNMEPRTLEEVRMLTNVNAQNEYLLHLIILGQPELRVTLERPELRQLTQRVSVFYHIGALSLKDAEQYVAHRLHVAGGDPELFSAEAIETIWQQARGIPRIINTLCDLSLVYGYSAGQRKIGKTLIQEVVHDRNEMGLKSAEFPGGEVSSAMNNPALAKR